MHQLNEGRVGTARSDFDQKNKRNLGQPSADLILKTTTDRRYSLKSRRWRGLSPDLIPTKKLWSDKDDSSASARASSLDKISEFNKVQALIQLQITDTKADRDLNVDLLPQSKYSLRGIKGIIYQPTDIK